MTDQATRFRLDIAYQGTDFAGWARQPDLRTVQGTLEEALATIFRCSGEPPSLTVAGRTDAGVHATGQVAHVDLSPEQVALLRRPHGKREPQLAHDALKRRVNGVLGPVPDVLVSRATEAPAGFDARFSALWRRYEYRVADRIALRDPLQRHRTAWVPNTLDVDAMDRGAHGMLGLHDFASYCKAREGATTIRTLQAFSWRRDAEGVLLGEVAADAFCHSMVRALVGACVEVGEGKLRPGDLVTLRDERQRTSAFKVMPARGLTLREVGYPVDAELGRRAEQTRGLRTL
ncbi:pseudouridine synthase [Leifsonia xyli subsp. xyli]|uniref:tRNA pseudouridine synthase A n=2 Tax=Leifsonia xyli subsp. xyli TaxID=59736 RepID=TRUA_LEIXX|nr:tRNA pseudouridine(38-40) synthase TruA [Leifsonia xyli]Q6AD25.1 RecName: Full=tRNA pseudouridine synthase A; AltName: Full=tRNA pseudouridine(38-40) synthase; AltName: Full=tRNA pseudouridylate synthase I; AltName: Full=tRNA-uridine isomerase I [Leifsonia xyli subsp. xyli str. CTCB07]AAT89719.1 tRNA pseudouridine synthase A [Leifsonia xyli subsp. xyli str. CTCB07]ODA91179.1 pseudouridine synthase [Leifsonia xyli subsp. xyli]